MSVIGSQTHAFKSLPITKNHFGLIHGDLHHHNFLRKEVELTLLDFGDSEYHW
ncbi:phosphotransferase [Brevibacillus brevis]|uniref:phosphotransferase n=1 Tax=Brevibacillus brevis TaxID=1393 RepID=UPI000AAE3A63